MKIKVLKIFRGILLIVLPVAILVYFAQSYTAQQSLIYKSAARLLLIQSSDTSFDPSNAIRGAEKIAGNLAKVVRSDDFLNQVLLTNPELTNKLPKDSKTKRDSWQSMVVPSSDGSFLDINVFHSNPKFTRDIASTTAFVLINQASLWHGSGEDLVIKLIDQPLVPTQPVRPNLKLNMAVAAAIGLILGASMIYYLNYFERRKF